MTTETLVERFLTTFALSMAFGLARQRMGKPIGFGTFILVATGACALAITAMNLDATNPMPLLAATVTGIGFLGAGALIHGQERTYGFTSAATIWIVAVFGLCMGSGRSLLGYLIYGALWIVFGIDRVLEHRWIGAYQRRLTIDVRLSEDLDAVLARLALNKRRLRSVSIDRELGLRSLMLDVRQVDSPERTELIGRLERDPDVQRFRFE